MAAVSAPTSGGVSASGLRQEATAKATETMFEKISEYVKGELHGKCDLKCFDAHMTDQMYAASVEDYKLLERLNKMATENFSDLTNKTKEVAASIQHIQDKAKEIQPCLDEIDVLESSASELLNTAQLLDDYSKRVGKRLDMHVVRSLPNSFLWKESKYKELMMARRT